MTAGEPVPRGEIVEECGVRFEVFALPTDEASLLAILNECFEEWEQIRIGPLIPGAIWEIRPPRRPVITLLDGYATIDFQDWHCHICIGGGTNTSPETVRFRRTNIVELYRRLDRAPAATSWGLRFLNGAGDQQISFMLPSQTLTDGLWGGRESEPRHSTLWECLRRRYWVSSSGGSPEPASWGPAHD